MACFLVPAAVAAITTVCARWIPEKYHISWLNVMLWTVVGALAVEHFWSGEVVPWFPFLTATATSADVSIMLNEMATIGGAMLIGVVAIWAALVLVYNRYAEISKPQASA
ncbi:MAG: hypothetical protein AB7D42_01190 [Candidatus Methanomethylophilaceae archaeon]|nr:hypothetical protein [Candidatus Methanomethylophilaceae archaeon]